MRQPESTAGYDLVVAASWLPVHTDPLRWRDGAGNAARVLRAAVASRGGAWVGVTNQRPDEAALLDNVWLHPVALDPATAEDYLHGHCYTTLSPLYYDSGPAPVFRPHWRVAYRRVNHRVAERIAQVAAPGATVWIHDYHLQLVPGYLRAGRPDIRIGFFLHSPFPAVERFKIQPQRDNIVDSLCAADLVGFQHVRAAMNFTEVVGARPRLPAVGVFPASIEVNAIEGLTRIPAVRRAATAIRNDLGNPHRVLLSIGAPEQADASRCLLDAYAQLLAEGRVDPDRTTLVHLAVCGDDPSHMRCDRGRIDRAIAQINGVYGRIGRPAVHYVHREQSLRDVVALYLATDVMLALPLRDGMCLAAKEYLAARTDNSGHLILSEFSGAADELTSADLVNPYDIDAVKNAIVKSTHGHGQPTEHIAKMRRDLTANDAEGWIDKFLASMSRCGGGVEVNG